MVPPPQPVQLPIVRLPIVAMLDLSSVVEARLEIYKDVVVAFLARSEVTVVEARVEEACVSNPPLNAMIVEVLCELSACLVKGQAKLQPVQEVTVRAPMFAVLARRLVVEARPEI